MSIAPFEKLPGSPAAVGICRDVIFPVCAPDMAARLCRPADLTGATCLHDATWREDWKLWTAAAFPEPPGEMHGPVFSLYSLAVEEARNGAGVLIGHEPLIRDHLAAGALVAPFDLRLPLDRRMSIRKRPADGDSPVLDMIIDALSSG